MIFLKLNVPQGAILDTDAYAYFTKPVMDIVHANKLNAMFYADDSQLHVHFNSSYASRTAQAVQFVESCCSNVKDCMCWNLLKLNEDKTEVILFGSL